MIRYIKGTLMKAEEGRIVVLVGGVGYEILLPEIVWQSLPPAGDANPEIELFISYHQTAQQPKPALIGFTSELELEFFERLITVKDIGPVMASRALTMPVPVIARAIEDRDATTIRKLKGIGNRKADMMISELNGKVGKYALMREESTEATAHAADFTKQVIGVLVKQLGHSRNEADKMVIEALQRRPDAATPEELFEEVYRGTKGA
ncbi:Holliday junction branch migration protein RuvA [Thermodesulfobacteriota bacterium]